MSEETDVWVELETNKGTKYTSTYRGRVSPETLEKWSNGELGTTAIRLDDVHWADYGEGKPEVDINVAMQRGDVSRFGDYWPENVMSAPVSEEASIKSAAGTN